MRSPKPIFLLGLFLLASTPFLFAVPTTDFVHTLSASEITPDPTGGEIWVSPRFSFGEEVVLDAGDTLNLRVEFAGTQVLEFGQRDDGESLGIRPNDAVFVGDIFVGGVWTFLGVQGDLRRNDIGVGISNIPMLIVPLTLFDRGGGSASFSGVEVDLTFPSIRGSLALDGFSLYLTAGDIRIHGSASATTPEPGTLALLGWGAAGFALFRLRRRKSEDSAFWSPCSRFAHRVLFNPRRLLCVTLILENVFLPAFFSWWPGTDRRRRCQ